MAAVSEKIFAFSATTPGSIHASASPPHVLIDEDGDSRDSELSLPLDDKPLKIEELTTIQPTRQALVDCSNLVSKPFHNSNRSILSIHTNGDTPVGRKSKSVFAIVERSQYDVVPKQAAQRSDSSSDSSARKRSCSPTTTSAFRKRSKQIMLEEDVLDDVFLAPKQSDYMMSMSVSMFDVSGRSTDVNAGFPQMHVQKRTTSDDSLNGSFRSGGCNTKTTMRAMSVGCIDMETGAIGGQASHLLEVNYAMAAVDRPQKESQAFRSISCRTLLSEFERLGEDFHEFYVVVDCRYPYEYNGGHVKGAKNIYHKTILESVFFPSGLSAVVKKKIPIFYCEFSQKRGPTMAHELRSIDRVRNELNYPHVEYPEIYLLDHGYRALWNDDMCKDICEPRSYVRMDDPKHISTLRKFKGARHRSVAEAKSSGDLTSVGIRKASSSRRLRRNFSLFDVSNSGCSKIDEVFFDALDSSNLLGVSDTAVQRAHSAFELNVFTDEVDVDSELSMLMKVTEEASEAVKLSVMFKTPDLPIPAALTELEKNEVGEEGEGPSTPRAKLDFSHLSDNEA